MSSLQVYRFSSYESAESFKSEANVGYAILLGDDFRFWVPKSNRETSRLIREGYEVAPRW